jgi:7-cyano-7-deazaguanine synthase
VLLSGGLDSAVNLALAARHTRLLLALTFDYGQRAARPEIAASRGLCRALSVPHRVIRLPWLARLAHESPLVSRRRPLPRLNPRQLSSRKVASGKTARAVWIPNRNGLFLNIAACFAEALRADLILAGFNAEEAATFPDNSLPFVRALNRAFAFSTLRPPKAKSYTQKLTKPQIAALARKLGLPLNSIWSCYGGGPRPCGRCESCARLRRALSARGA